MRGFYCLSLSLFDQTMLVWHELVCLQCLQCAQSPDIRIWCQIATQCLRLLGPGSSSVYTHHTGPVLSQISGRPVIFSVLSNTVFITSHVTHCLLHLTRDSISPNQTWQHWHWPRTWTHDVLAWVSPRDWRRWELSGGQGRVYTCTLTAALNCGLYNVNGKFYYSSNTSLLNLCVIVANTFHIHLSKTNTRQY